METTLAFKEGDIFRWSYKEDGDDRAWGRYHCCSRIAIFCKGRLRDTYWQIGTSFSDGRSFGADEADRLVLEFVANIDDLEKSSEFNDEYYDNADIVNLNHANSTRGNFYLRKGAVRSAQKMLQSARYKMNEASATAKSARRRADELREIIARIEGGDTSVHI